MLWRQQNVSYIYQYLSWNRRCTDMNIYWLASGFDSAAAIAVTYHHYNRRRGRQYRNQIVVTQDTIYYT